MKIAFFDTHEFEKETFLHENSLEKHEIRFLNTRLTVETAALARDYPCVCAFVNDDLGAATLERLQHGGTKLIALRSAGFSHVDLAAAKRLSMKVVRVPEYSPYAVAEHVVAMIQTLNRKTHRAFNRVRDGNFSLDGLVGFDLHQKTVGIVGTGHIGRVLAKIMRGFGCHVLLNDLKPDEVFASESGCSYVSLDELLAKSDIISLHVPLTRDTHHFINAKSLALMKKGVMLINSGRGGLIDAKDLILFLRNGHIGYAGLDVYEEEAGIFFEDLSGTILTDDVLTSLMSFPNVLITSHQAFLTVEALHNIAATTLSNITNIETERGETNEIEKTVS